MVERSRRIEVCVLNDLMLIVIEKSVVIFQEVKEYENDLKLINFMRWSLSDRTLIYTHIWLHDYVFIMDFLLLYIILW